MILNLWVSGMDSHLRWYSELFQNARIMDALKYTLIIAVLASIIATIIGTLAAIGIHRMKGVPKKTLTKYKLSTCIKP